MDYIRDLKGFRFSDSKTNSTQYSQIIVSPRYNSIFAKRATDGRWETMDMDIPDHSIIESECEPLYLDDEFYAICQNNMMKIIHKN